MPSEHIKDGKIILNISESAAHNLKLANDAVSFRARFGGVPFDVWVPAASILGIYARETGQGMIFSHDSGTGSEHRCRTRPTTSSRYAAAAAPQGRQVE